MNQIIQAVEHIRSLPGAEVDCHYGQGRDAFAAHLRLCAEGTALKFDVDVATAHGQEWLAELEALVAPHQLPAAYRLFLEYYGGLSIKQPLYTFSISGLGPLTNDLYFDLLGDDGWYDDGLLYIGLLTVAQGDSRAPVEFFLDVGGTVESGCVMSVRHGGVDVSPFETPLAALSTPRDTWAKVADSWTEWLLLVAETAGLCGYVSYRHTSSPD